MSRLKAHTTVSIFFQKTRFFYFFFIVTVMVGGGDVFDSNTFKGVHNIMSTVQNKGKILVIILKAH